MGGDQKAGKNKEYIRAYPTDGQQGMKLNLHSEHGNRDNLWPDDCIQVEDQHPRHREGAYASQCVFVKSIGMHDTHCLIVGSRLAGC